MFTIAYNQKGFVAFFITILVLAIMLGLAFSITILVLGEQRISKNIVKSTQAYYIAEAGVEDALLRLKKNPAMSALSYDINVSNGIEGNVNILDIIGGSRVITVQGDVSNRIRKIQVVYAIDTDTISFHYGAQIGEGGIIMDDGSTINGNVFSNGSVIAVANTQITGTVWVAKEGNKIQGANVGEDAYTHTCKDSTIVGTLTYISGGSVINCTAGESIKERPTNIDPKELPITNEQIQNWKDEALSGGIISGDYILSGTTEAFLGPKKIEGNMIIQDKTKLFITGEIWVTGDITIQNFSKVKLDQDSYGSLGGVIISDGKITLQDDAQALGSGIAGSYLLLLSTAVINPAIIIQNSFEADIIYAQNGWILVQDTADIREATGYGIHLKNNAEIFYEVGLEDASFSSGPGGSWQIKDWSEVE